MLNVSPLLLSGVGVINNGLTILGFFSLGIYVTHYLVIWWIAVFICKFGIGGVTAEVAVVFVLGLVSSLILVWILNNKYTAKVFLGKI